MRQDLQHYGFATTWTRRMWAFGIVCLIFGNVAIVEGKSLEENFVKYHRSPTVRVISKLGYAKYGTRQLFLDLYLPLPLGQNRPGVVVVRGGGWKVGDRKRFAHVASALAERGVAAACIEYRTADRSPFPGAIQDVKAAVRWMRANAAKYGIDPQVIGTMGGSSGAHMALLAGLTTGVSEFEGAGGNASISSEIQGVVAMAVPADLLTLTSDNKLTVGEFLHTTPEQGTETWRWASPVSHIRSDGPPVLLLHGSDDDSVPPKQSTDFADRYRQAGANVEVHVLNGAPHAFWNYHPWFDDAADLAGAFFLRLEMMKRNHP
jgi:acetyl esterase/lipase